MGHCECSEEDRETYYEDISPDFHDGKTMAEKCRNCGDQLVRIH